jgi:hypothetical protein
LAGCRRRVGQYRQDQAVDQAPAAADPGWIHGLNVQRVLGPFVWSRVQCGRELYRQRDQVGHRVGELLLQRLVVLCGRGARQAEQHRHGDEADSQMAANITHLHPLLLTAPA